MPSGVIGQSLITQANKFIHTPSHCLLLRNKDIGSDLTVTAWTELNKCVIPERADTHTYGKKTKQNACTQKRTHTTKTHTCVPFAKKPRVSPKLLPLSLPADALLPRPPDRELVFTDDAGEADALAVFVAVLVERVLGVVFVDWLAAMEAPLCVARVVGFCVAF